MNRRNNLNIQQVCSKSRDVTVNHFAWNLLSRSVKPVTQNPQIVRKGHTVITQAQQTAMCYVICLITPCIVSLHVSTELIAARVLGEMWPWPYINRFRYQYGGVGPPRYRTVCVSVMPPGTSSSATTVYAISRRRRVFRTCDSHRQHWQWQSQWAPRTQSKKTSHLYCTGVTIRRGSFALDSQSTFCLQSSVKNILQRFKKLSKVLIELRIHWHILYVLWCLITIILTFNSRTGFL